MSAISLNGNGISINSGNIPPKAEPTASGERCPRRLVLLDAGEDSAVKQVLSQYVANEVSGRRLLADLQRLSAEHPGQCVAAEWLGPLGWTRFLWCRR
jgi:hypothetical protein